MSKAKIYLRTSCSTCRDALEFLAQKKIAPDRRDFFKEPFTVQELRALLDSLGLTAHDVVSRKSPSYKALKLDADAMSEAELLAQMVEEPRLIRRPLIVLDGKPIVGFDREELSRALT